ERDAQGEYDEIIGRVRPSTKKSSENWFCCLSTDHCSKQCCGNAWAARALEVQEEAPGLLMRAGQSQ
ncbi:hypothetical protein H8959_008955, partial [Pygathrix nigripes]